MEIQIDGQTIKIFSEDKNIVDVAKRARIGIPRLAILPAEKTDVVKYV